MPEGGWQKGSILLGGLAAILIGIVLIAWQPWDDGGSSAKTGTTAPTTTQAARQNAGSGWTVRSRYTLKPVPGASGKAIAGIETKANQAALLIAGAGLPGSSTVGIWFQGPTGSGLVGFQKVDAKGQFTAIGPLPAIVTKANRIIVTRETAPVGSAAPKQPGPVLLTAPFKLV